MSSSYEIHMLIQQLQIKPYDFLKTLKTQGDDVVLVFLTHIFMNGDLSLFHNLILFLGQEYENGDSTLIRALRILQESQDDIYFYVLDNLIPIIFNFQVASENSNIHIFILHLSNYEPLLTKAIQFIQHMDNLEILIEILRDHPKFYKPLLNTISQDDAELANLIRQKLDMEIVKNNNKNNKNNNKKNNSNNNSDNNDIEDQENIKLKLEELKSPKPSSVVLDSYNEELNTLDNIPQNMIEKSQSIIKEAINDISEFSQVPHNKVQQEKLEETIKNKSNLIPNNANNLDTNLIHQAQDESIKQNKRERSVNTFEEYIDRIPEEKMELLAALMNLKEKDSLFAIANNKSHLSKIVKPSCDKLGKMLEQPIAWYNKLRTNHRKIGIPKLEKNLREKDEKPILYFDGMNGILCEKEKNNQKHICSYRNPYSDFFVKYEPGKFNIKKQIYNLEVWLILLSHILYHNNVDNKELGKLTDLYSVNVIVHQHILEKLLGKIQPNQINIAAFEKINIIGVGDLITHELLGFYLYSKFYKEGDILLTGSNYDWLNHGEGISLNGNYKQVEEFLPFKIPDMNSLVNTLTKIYKNYNFTINKVHLGAIKEKKLTKKKSVSKKDKKDKNGNDIKSNYATFEIKKNNGKSTLVKSKNLEKPYKYLFKEIFKFSEKSDEDIKTECQIYHYPNVMRRIFEEWYSFKIGKDLNLTSSRQDRIINDLNIKKNSKKTELGILLKVCNILSHSINDSKNPQEIHQSAKYLMDLIRENDKLHFDKMKQ